MKLIFCPNCQDVRKLNTKHIVSCDCGKSFGKYNDNLNATIGGDAIPLGFANNTLSNALKMRPIKGMGRTFTAFVIPVECPTIKQGKLSEIL